MRDLVILFVHVIATLARLLGPGGIRSVVAESVLIKQQLLILNRSGSDHPTCALQIALLPVCVLFSPKRKTRPGPHGPNKELIEAVVQTKQRNPTWGCPGIAQQIALAFDIPIDKDIVRRILASHYRQGSGGPSWLTFIGHPKDSLWSIDLFQCESATLRTHWILVVMDQYTGRIIGFGVHAGAVHGIALCRMFNQAIRGCLWRIASTIPGGYPFLLGC